MTTRFNDNPAYRTYESLLTELHRLVASGQNDTTEVDAIHIQMDDVEPRLSQREIERLNGLSSDLYMLQGKEALAPTEMTQQQFTEALNDAHKRDDWEQVLCLLRMQSHSVPEYARAYLRARAYDQLGSLDTALLFMEQAALLKPENKNYENFVIIYLSRLNQLDKALRRAERYVQADNTSISGRIQYAALLFMAAEESRGNNDRSYLRKAIDVLVPALHEATQDEDISKRELLLGFLTLGSCYEDLDDNAAALTAFSNALQVDPDDIGALTLHGILLAQSDLEGAAIDFECAIANNDSSVTPYFYVAYASLRRGDYKHCLELCRKIQSMTNEPDALAAVWQWIAISQYYLDFPINTVVQNAQSASDLDPVNPQLQQTLALFQSMQALVERPQNEHLQPLDIFTLGMSRPDPRNYLHFSMAA